MRRFFEVLLKPYTEWSLQVLLRVVLGLVFWGRRLAGLIDWSVSILGRKPFFIFLTLTLISVGALSAARFSAGLWVTSEVT